MVIETIQVTSDLIEKGVELLQQDCLPLLKNGSRLTPQERSITIIWPQCLENIHHSKFKPINWFGTKLISPKPQNVLVIYLHSAHQGQLAVAIVLQHFRQLRGCTQQRLKASFWGVYTPKTKEPHRLTILYSGNCKINLMTKMVVEFAWSTFCNQFLLTPHHLLYLEPAHPWEDFAGSWLKGFTGIFLTSTACLSL